MVVHEHCEITGVPDKDVLELGEVGGPPPIFVHHYYARSNRYEWSYPDGGTAKATVSARTEMKLYTGGKAGIKRKSLIHINAWAEQYGRPPDGPWLDTPTTDVLATRIEVLGWCLFGRHLDPSGDLYLPLPDNEVKDLRLRVPGVKHYGAWAEGTKLRLELDSITFQGRHGDIRRDDDSADYSPPHWQTNDTAGTVTSHPVLYVSGSEVQTSTNFKRTGNGSFPVIVKGKVSGGATSFTLWGTNDTPAGPICDFYMYPDNPLTASRVDFYNPMKIKWQYSSKSKLDFLDAGVSTNQVYVTLRVPTNSVTLFHTVAHLACANPGATTDAQAVANTWSFFAGPGNVKTWDGRELHYYQAGIPWANDVTDAGNLLAARNGQCNSWRDLLERAWLANGTVSEFAEVTASGQLFLVKNWSFGSSSLTNNPPYDYLLLLDGSNGSMVGVTDYGDLENSTGVPGQHSPTPAEKAFGSHYVQRFNGVYYDPSYGVTYTDEADFQAKAVAGFGTNPSYAYPGRIAYEIKQTTSTVEIQIVP